MIECYPELAIFQYFFVLQSRIDWFENLNQKIDEFDLPLQTSTDNNTWTAQKALNTGTTCSPTRILLSLRIQKCASSSIFCLKILIKELEHMLTILVVQSKCCFFQTRCAGNPLPRSSFFKCFILLPE